MRLKTSFQIFAVLFSAALMLSIFAVSVPAHEGEDHSKTASAGNASQAGKTGVTIARAERSIQSEAGQFTVRLERAPSDPRAGETSQLAMHLAEKVEGGFGSGAPIAIEDAIVSVSVITSDGVNVTENLPAKFDKGFYRAAYAFGDSGNYKVVFNVVTSDKREIKVDFPVTVVRAAVNWTFWLGITVLGLLSGGIIAAGYLSARKNGAPLKDNRRKLAPVALATILLFALASFTFAYFYPPRTIRAASDMPPIGTDAAEPSLPDEAAADSLKSSLMVSKESQILFGIKTEPVSVREITSGLKTSGIVRARPDASGIVVPPVAGRIVLREGLALGSVVGRGEQIGSVEQILDVSGQTELESQRLEAEAQQRDVEAKRLDLKNTALALQGQQAQQRAAAAQARTRLAQAQRELRRSENLLEVGAAPRRRVEEAQTAVHVAEQEILSADQQVKLLGDQVKAAQSGQNIFRAPRVNQPARSFPLTSPISGVVTEIKATSGQIAESGAPLLSVVNLATVLLEAQVFERDLPAVRESTKASFTASALSGEIYTIGTPDGDGRLISIGQTVDPQTRTVPVIYEIKNPSQRLRGGNFVEITIDTSGGAKVLAVPKNSVINDQGQTFVFVFTGGESFERRAVALGAEGGDFFEVKSGLKEGDRVVTEGIYQLRATQPTT